MWQQSFINIKSSECSQPPKTQSPFYILTLSCRRACEQQRRFERWMNMTDTKRQNQVFLTNNEVKTPEEGADPGHL